MNEIRTLLSSDVPLVAVSFTDNDSDRLAKEAKSAGVDIAELRIDQFSRIDVDYVLEHVRDFRTLPTLATIRSVREGGGWRGTEEERLAVLHAVMPLVDAVDIELSSHEILEDVIAAARHHNVVSIGSYHNFDLTPSSDELEDIVSRAHGSGADLVKVSTMVQSGEDLKRLASLLLKMDGDPGLIVIAMGAVGTVSRVFFPALGSRITYAFIGGRPAPGQLDYTDTFHLLRKFYPDYNQRKVIAMELLENV